ncbi:MAG: hypothetical protein RPU64_10770 [Candidatus Sedimenticola sp. (ex Thyasira tokunagai)]
MSDYELIVELEDADIDHINDAGQAITIVKNLKNIPYAKDGYPVAWLAFKPFEKNTITWVNEYGVYASNTVPAPGKKLVQNSEVEVATVHCMYPFSEGMFHAPHLGTKNSYGVENSTIDTYVFGLNQSATVNSEFAKGVPLNAEELLGKETVEFTPHESVYVFLYKRHDNGVIISEVVSTALKLDFTTVHSITIHYDSATAKFALGPLPRYFFCLGELPVFASFSMDGSESRAA